MPGVVEVEHVGTQDIEIKSKKMSEAKKKIYAKNLKSTDACGKLVEQVIKAELWMSFVKKFKQQCSPTQVSLQANGKNSSLPAQQFILSCKPFSLIAW